MVQGPGPCLVNQHIRRKVSVKKMLRQANYTAKRHILELEPANGAHRRAYHSVIIPDTCKRNDRVAARRFKQKDECQSARTVAGSVNLHFRVERIVPLGSSGEKNAKPHASRRALRALLSTGPGGLITSVPKSSVSDTEGHHWLLVKKGVVSGNSEQKTWNALSETGGGRHRRSEPKL